MDPITRIEAEALGLKLYFTGVACRSGHTAPRRVLNYTCEECNSARQRASYARNPEPAKTRRKAQYEADPEKARRDSREWAARHRTRVRRRKAAHYAGDPEPSKARSRRTRTTDADRHRAQRRERAAAMPEAKKREQYEKKMAGVKASPVRRHRYRVLLKVARANRRIREAAAGTCLTIALVERRQVQQAGLCFYCLAAYGEAYHVEHIVPLAKGGDNRDQNIALACQACNARKGSMMPQVFLRRLAVRLERLHVLPACARPCPIGRV